MKYILWASWGIPVSRCFFTWIYSNYFWCIRKKAVKVITCLTIYNWVNSVVKSPAPSLLVIHWQFLSNSNEEYISFIIVDLISHLFFWFIRSFMTFISLKHRTLFSPGLQRRIYKTLMQKSSIRSDTLKGGPVSLFTQLYNTVMYTEFKIPLLAVEAYWHKILVAFRAFLRLDKLKKDN